MYSVFDLLITAGGGLIQTNPEVTLWNIFAALLAHLNYYITWTWRPQMPKAHCSLRLAKTLLWLIVVIAGNDWTVPLYLEKAGVTFCLEIDKNSLTIFLFSVTNYLILYKLRTHLNNNVHRLQCSLFSHLVFASSRWNDPEWRITWREPSSNMADQKHTNMEVDNEKNGPFANKVKPLVDTATKRTGDQSNVDGEKDAGESRATSEYCEKLQAWMWQYYTGYVNWQSWLAASAMSYPHYLQSPSGTSTASLDFNSQHWYSSSFSLPLSPYPPAVSISNSRVGEVAGGAAVPGQPQQQQQQPQENGNAQRPGKSSSDCWAC